MGRLNGLRIELDYKGSSAGYSRKTEQLQLDAFRRIERDAASPMCGVRSGYRIKMP